MATKKSASNKQSSATSNFRIISWLKFLPNLPKKRLAIILLTIIVLSYAAFVTTRSLYGGYCNDWVFLSSDKLNLKSLSFDRPEGWQSHYCFTDNESDYSMVMMRDYQIPDLARLAWISGFSDGWGMFAPTNSGLIEAGVGNTRANESLDQIEKRYAAQTPPAWYKRTIQRITVDGRDALQIIAQQDPNPNDKHSTRYNYYNDIIIEDNGQTYSLRLWGDWYKSESRDAWVAKYEPVFDHLISTAEFK